MFRGYQGGLAEPERVSTYPRESHPLANTSRGDLVSPEPPYPLYIEVS
jgi:hypothetical protein